MWLINIIVIKLKIILMLISKLKYIFIFNTLKLVYNYFFFCDKEQKLFTLLCQHPIMVEQLKIVISFYWR
jgi:hypothetical protein